MSRATLPSRDRLLTAYQREHTARLADISRRARVLAQVIDLNRFPASRALWLAAVLALVTRHYRDAALAGLAHYQRLRDLEDLPPSSGVLLPTFNADRAAGALVVAGPVELFRRLRRGVDPVVALRWFSVETSTTAASLAADGAHQAIAAAAAQDPQAIGWARRLSPGACSWCAMLASRGAVYSKATVGFGGHGKAGHCRCTAVPVFTTDQRRAIKADTEPLRALWSQARDGTNGGSSQVAAFRRLWDERPDLQTSAR